MSMKSDDIKLEMYELPHWVIDSKYETEFERNILLSVHQRDIRQFRNLLQRGVDIAKYGTAIKTCMEMCCRRPGYEDFVATLLKAKFHPNTIIIRPGITAIHLATISSNSSALKILLSSSKTNVNMISGHGKTALHYVAERILESPEDEEAVGRCVEVLLRHPTINVNMCSITDWTLNGNALHLAARCDNHTVVKALLEDRRLDVNAEDAYGWTALHYAVRHCRTPKNSKDVSRNCALLLLNVPYIDVNKKTHKLSFQVTALHLAAAVGNFVALEALINDKRTSVSALDIRERNALHYAAEQSGPRSELVKRDRFAIAALVHFADIDFNCPDFYEWIALHLAVSKGNFAYVIVMLQEDGGTELSSADMSKRQTARNSDHKSMAKGEDEERIRQCISLLMNHPLIGINEPSYNGLTEDVTPLFLAAKSGNYIALEELIMDKRTDVNIVDPEKRTVLHYAVEQYGSERAQRCISLLLGGSDKQSGAVEATRYKHDINARDSSGNTALHLAAERKAQQSVLTLLRHGASLAQRGNNGSPVPNIAPTILEEFLDECVGTNRKSQEDQHFQINFSYSFLTRNDNDLECYYPESDPLYRVAHCKKTKHLLKHPVLSSFLYLKWHRVRNYFYANVIYHMVFVILLNLFILERVGNEYNSPGTATWNNTNETAIYNNHSNGSSINFEYFSVFNTNSTSSSQNVSHGDKVMEGLWILLRLLLAGLMLKEMFQLFISPRRYILNADNYVELFVIGGSIVNLYSYKLVSADLMPHVSSITILLSWVQLVLLTGRLPILSCQLEMLKKVSWTFIRFLAWYSFLIIAFAMSFYTLFRGKVDNECNNDETEVNYFETPALSLVKTIVMMSGEFEASSLSFSLAPITSEIVFLMFVFLVAIVMLNLLNGLAVSDTQYIRQEAEVLSLISRVRLIYYIESMLLGDPLSKCWVSKRLFRYLRRKWACFRRMHMNILLFPYVVLENKIWVVPNRENRVVFSEPLNMTNERIQVSYNYERSWCKYLTLDSGIVKSAVDIINIKEGMEMDNYKETENKLNKTIKHIDRYVKDMSKQIELRAEEKQKVLQMTLDQNLERLQKKLDDSMRDLETRVNQKLQDIQKTELENKQLLNVILQKIQQNSSST